MPVKLITDLINTDLLHSRMLRVIAKSLMEHTARKRFDLFEAYISGKKILDVGLGTGAMSNLLSKKGYKVTSIDVTNTSLYPQLSPLIYDGLNFPFSRESFDVGLIIVVLHHCSNQTKVLEEAMRVCKRIVIIEDTYRNRLEKVLVSARDCVGNFEFYHHPYHTTKEWTDIFLRRGWNITYLKEWSNLEFYGMYGRHSLFVIDKK